MNRLTIAEIAGRLAAGMLFKGFDTPQIALKAVELTRAIEAEVARTEPGADFKGMSPAPPADPPAAASTSSLDQAADLVERTANGQHRRGFYLTGYAHLAADEWRAVASALRIKAGGGTFDQVRLGDSVRVKGGVVTITPSHIEVACAGVEAEIRALCERRQVDWRDAASFIVRKHGTNGPRAQGPDTRRPGGQPISWGDQREKS